MEYLFIGIGIGVVLGWFLSRGVKKDGVIIIDDSDKNTTKWYLNVKTDPEKIPEKRTLRLQVHVQK